MQGMVARKRSRGKPRQRWEKYITDTFGMVAAASKVAEDRHQFRRDIWALTSWRGYAPRLSEGGREGRRDEGREGGRDEGREGEREREM